MRQIGVATHAVLSFAIALVVLVMGQIKQIMRKKPSSSRPGFLPQCGLRLDELMQPARGGDCAGGGQYRRRSGNSRKFPVRRKEFPIMSKLVPGYCAKIIRIKPLI
jgi:hypothetical protein